MATWDIEELLTLSKQMKGMVRGWAALQHTHGSIACRPTRVHVVAQETTALCCAYMCDACAVSAKGD